MSDWDRIGYYYIIDPGTAGPSLIKQVESIADSGLGVQYYQYRENGKQIQDSIAEIKDIRSILPDDAFLVVNGRLDIALSYADGVHLGDNSIRAEDAVDIVRNRLRNQVFMIGASASSVETVKMLNPLEVDYVTFGPLFGSPIKNEAGIFELKRAVRSTVHPIIATGGITMDNLETVLNAGPDGVSVSGILKDGRVDMDAIRHVQRHYRFVS
mgnify:CR=1 FL=1